MRQYVRFSVTCTSEKQEEQNIYCELKARLKKYLLDSDMELYRIPIPSKEYDYVYELSLQYHSEQDWDEVPGLYIVNHEYIETVYSPKDYQDGVAYLVNFWYFAYTYDDVAMSGYVDYCCENYDWRYENALVQRKTLPIPKSEFKKRKYAKLQLGYAVDKEVVDLLVEAGVAVKEDFKEVNNRKGDIVSYQIAPQNIVYGFAKDNNMRLVDQCRNCGLERYGYGKEPFCISDETYTQLKGLNRTCEVLGPIIENYKESKEEKLCSIVEPWYIVNKQVYNILKSKYPKMQFIPIFKKK